MSQSQQTENTETPADNEQNAVEPAEQQTDSDSGENEPAGEAEAPPPEGAGEPVEAPSESPEDTIVKLESDLASTHDKLLRAVAETENVRRRAQRDKEDMARYAVTNFARDLIGVADNLRRALESVDEGTRKENPSIENLLIGVEMTERELLTAFEKSNIRRMEPVGQKFDPNVHEAMFEYDDPSRPAGTVGQVIETGYMLHDRPLRPAKVGITKGGAKSEALPETPPAPADETAEPPAYENRTGEPGEHIDEEL